MKRGILNLEKVSFKSILWNAIPLVFIVFMVLFFPFRYRFEFDHDEGINAIKSMLSIQGYQLYSDTWSDQPPLFNLLLTNWFQIFGMNVTAGRIFVLLFSAATLWLAIYYLRRHMGNFHAAFGILALILLPFYLRLSVSIMIGLPSITLAMLSFVALVVWHEQGSDRWLILSACALGLSIMTKLFTAFLVPIFFCGILISRLSRFRNFKELFKAFLPLILWFTVLILVVGIFLLIIVKPEYVYQLTQVHLTANDSTLFRTYAENRISRFSSYLMDSSTLIILAFLGGISAYHSKYWSAFYLVAWVVIGAILLSVNVPFWYHHQLLITIPAAILAAVAVGDGINGFLKFLRRRETLGISIGLSTISMIVAIAFLVNRLPPTLEQLDQKFPNLRGLSTEDLSEYEILASMWNYAEHTNWVYTDRPMFAFRTLLPVPPQLAVISKKRIAAGYLPDEKILEILDEYEPEQVFQERIDLPVVQEYISRRNFRRVDASKKFRLYVHPDILELSGSISNANNQK